MYIGVDGGGTKTTVALADKKGNIVARLTGGPSSPRNIGIDATIENVYKLIKEVQKDNDILSSFIALPGVEEEFAEAKELIAEKLKEKGVQGKIVVGSDQLSAFRAGTEKEEGVLVVAGTGSVAHGWRNKEALCGSWGYLADEGSAFWIGIEAFRLVTKELDGRGEKTKITEKIFKEWKISSAEELRKVVYSDFIKYIPQISTFVEALSDPLAEDILKRAGEELALSANIVTERLEFDTHFPLIVSGGVFQSKTVYNTFKKKVSPLAEVSLPVADPVKGAVLLAIL